MKNYVSSDLSSRKTLSVFSFIKIYFVGIEKGKGCSSPLLIPNVKKGAIHDWSHSIKFKMINIYYNTYLKKLKNTIFYKQDIAKRFFCALYYKKKTKTR